MEDSSTATKISYPTLEKLSFLLLSIHNRELALPDFQRDFVWEPRATDELIESIFRRFPAGSLLRIKNSASFYFAPREFQGAPPLDGKASAYLILDGQQRLTSLYQAFYGVGTHRFFVDLRGLHADEDLEDCVFYLRAAAADKRYGTIDAQAKDLVMPLSCLFGAPGGFEEWLDQVLDARGEPPEDQKTLKANLRAMRKRWLANVEDYEFPVIDLSEDTSVEAVCTIFETLNRTGVKLSVFDLLTARFWPEEVHLRDLWQQACDEYPILADFDVDPYYVLQAIALAEAEGAPSCKKNDVLKMQVSQVNEGWQPVVAGLSRFLRLLRDDCGVVGPRWLPYGTILIAGGAVLAKMPQAKGPDAASRDAKLKRWFWCSVFGQAYESAPNSQVSKDFIEVQAWLSGGSPPESVAKFSFDSTSLRETTPWQRAVYRGVIALLLRNRARDFHKATAITSSMMAEERIDDHHIFPRGHLKAANPSLASSAVDCVLNRTLIDKQTNIRIGSRAPSDYLGEIRNELGADALRQLLDSHLLPGKSDSPLFADAYEDFLTARQALIAAQIEHVTGA